LIERIVDRLPFTRPTYELHVAVQVHPHERPASLCDALRGRRPQDTGLEVRLVLPAC
jgi:hypothetical protein